MKKHLCLCLLMCFSMPPLYAQKQKQNHTQYFESLHNMTNRKMEGWAIEEAYAFDTENVTENFFSYAYPNHNAQYDVRILKIAQDREIAISAFFECKSVCETSSLQIWEFQSSRLTDISHILLPDKYDSIVKVQMQLVRQNKTIMSDTIMVGFWADLPRMEGDIKIGYMLYSKGERLNFVPFLRLLYDDKKKKFIFAKL